MATTTQTDGHMSPARGGCAPADREEQPEHLQEPAGRGEGLDRAQRAGDRQRTVGSERE